MVTETDDAMRKIREAEAAKFVYEVLGVSGRLYDVPKEVWDHVPTAYKRIIRKDN